MSDRAEDAVNVLRELPHDMQTAAARAVIEYAAYQDDDSRLPAA